MQFFFFGICSLRSSDSDFSQNWKPGTPERSSVDIEVISRDLEHLPEKYQFGDFFHTQSSPAFKK
jgi:hypothetical protein